MSLINIIAKTPFYNGGIDFINVIQFKNGLKVVSVDVNIEKLFINYLRKPNEISLSTNCEVNEIYHKDIVNLTVETILANIKDVDGYKMQKETNNNQILIK